MQRLPQLTAGSELCSAATVYYLSAVYLNAAHSLALEHIESILPFHSG